LNFTRLSRLQTITYKYWQLEEEVPKARLEASSRP
jgi:hypothetical protein